MTKTLSVITSVLNGRPFIEEMLASVPFDRSIEHLVVDAGSSDGTLDLLRQRAGLRLIVRPGLSLYAAWNEALTLAEGNYVLFLNADDLLAAEAVARIVPLLDGAVDVICGEAEAFQEDRDGVLRTTFRYRGHEIAGLVLDALVFGAPIINAKIFRRALLLEIGGFDPSFEFAGDRELMLRLMGKSPNVRYLPALLYRYRIHPGSMTLQQSARRRVHTAREHRRIAVQRSMAFLADRRTCEMMQQWQLHEAAVLLARGLAASEYGAVRESVVDLLRGGLEGLRSIAAARGARRAYAERLRASSKQDEELPK